MADCCKLCPQKEIQQKSWHEMSFFYHLEIHIKYCNLQQFQSAGNDCGKFMNKWLVLIGSDLAQLVASLIEST